MSNQFAFKSSLSTPILDRFRNQLNKNHQFTFSGDPTAVTTAELVGVYDDLLSELTVNSKPIITDLTIIADDFREHSEGIALAICDRILEVPVEQKMPSLYLLDSIVKNIGWDYIRHFAPRLPEVFCEVYRQIPPSLHASMRRLFETWSTVFPESVLHQIEDELQLSPSVNQPSSSLATMRASESPRRHHGIHVNPEYLESRNQFDNISVKKNIQFERGVPKSNAPSQTDYSVYEDYDYGENSDARRFYSAGVGDHVAFRPSANKLLPSASGSGRPLSPSADDFAVANSPGRMCGMGSSSHYRPSRVRRRDEEIDVWPKRHRSGDFNSGCKNDATFNVSNGFDHDGPRALIDAYGRDNGQRSFNKKIGFDRPFMNGMTTTAWQNTEEEEFDWEDMSPTLANRKTSNFTQSSVPSTTDLRGLPVNTLASRQSYYDHSSRSNWGNSEPILKTEDSLKAIEDVSQTQDGAFSFPGILTTPVQKLPVAGRILSSQLNINGAPRDGNQFQGVLTGVQPSTSLHSTAPLPPPYPLQQQPRPSSELMNSRSTVFNQGPRQFENDDNRSSISMNLARNPQPGFFPLHHQPQPPVSFPQQLPQFRHNIETNPLHVFHAYPSYQNASNSSMQSRGPVLPNAQGPRPFSPIVPLPQSAVPVANQPASVDISGLLDSGLLNSLISQGLLPLTKQLSEQDSIGVEFDADLLKVRHESAIRALYEDLPRQCTTCGLRFKTQDEHSKHMDWHVTKNRISKNRKHNPSRKWFVSANMWLSGTEALGVDATPAFLPSESAVENKDDEEMAVPADEDQIACALCGERFEDFYSDETEEWMYRGAVYLNTPCNKTTLGMNRSQLGPIVHAKCRSVSSSAPT
ncbi:hypothetical protein vseg_017400 [Gypsophila vaccaria]